MDLRTRFIEAYLAGEGTIQELSERFKIGSATGERWWRRHRDTGSVGPYRPGGGNPRLLTSEDLESIHLLVTDHPTATVVELIELFAQESGRSMSRTTMTRALKQLNVSRKKHLRTPTSRRASG